MKWYLVTLIFLQSIAIAAEPVGGLYKVESEDTGWALYADNDLLAGTNSDRDYTGGISLSVSGREARNSWLSLDHTRRGVNRLLGLDGILGRGSYQRHSLEGGMTVFTPGNLEDPAQQLGDRPYASLLYLASTGVDVIPERDVAYLTTFTLGVLGAPLIADLQRSLHTALGSSDPSGWDRQISDGGELTFRYSLARSKRAWGGSIGNAYGELTTTSRASVGYLSEVSFGVASRIGKIQSPWWSYNPQIADYAEKSVPVAAREGRGDEHYLWGGFNLRARAYNAFLEGQFRHSQMTFAHDELRPLVLEAWLGYTWAHSDGWRFSYVLRGQSSEIRGGPGDRNAVWGGLIVSHAF